MAALRAGCRKLAFSGAAALAERLADMAAQVGCAWSYERAPPPALDLAAAADPGRTSRAWLLARPAPPHPGGARR